MSGLSHAIGVAAQGRSRHFPAAMLALALISPMPAPATDTASAAERLVRSTTAQVLERLHANRETLESHPEQIYEIVQDLILPHIDFTTMSRWVLGQGWRKANAEQQERFTMEFRTLLVRTYANTLLSYSEEEIRFLPEIPGEQPDRTLIRSEIVQTGQPSLPMHYRMRQGKDKQWKVIDIIANGASLVGTYRNTFQTDLRTRGLDALIASLAERNAGGTPEDAAEKGS